MKIQEHIITSIKPHIKFDTRCITEHTADMNQRMAERIRRNESKISENSAQSFHIHVLSQGRNE